MEPSDEPGYLPMTKVTIDTGVLPLGDLLSTLEANGVSVVVVTATDRELSHPRLRPALQDLSPVRETAVWDETPWGVGVWSAADDERLEEILGVIGSGSFPKDRTGLSAGQLHQLRDAMVLHAHVREGRDIFVTTDERAFVRHGRRALLEARFATRIMTRSEFVGEFGAS